MLWYSKEPSQWDSSYELQKHMFNVTGKKMLQFYTQIFLFFWTYVIVYHHQHPQSIHLGNQAFISRSSYAAKIL